VHGETEHDESETSRGIAPRLRDSDHIKSKVEGGVIGMIFRGPLASGFSGLVFNHDVCHKRSSIHHPRHIIPWRLFRKHQTRACCIGNN
jgi:hypothetical protein